MKKLICMMGICLMAVPVLFGQNNAKVRVWFSGKAPLLNSPGYMRNVQPDNGRWETPQEWFNNRYRHIEDDKDTSWYVELPFAEVERLAYAENQPTQLVLRSKGYIRRDYAGHYDNIIHRLKSIERSNGDVCVAFDAIQTNYGKKVLNESQKKLILAVLETVKDEKLKADIMKDLDKGKISKKLQAPLSEVYMEYYKPYIFAKEMREMIEEAKGYGGRNWKFRTEVPEMLEYCVSVLDSGKYPELKRINKGSSYNPVYKYELPQDVIRTWKSQNKREEATFGDRVPNPFLPEELAKNGRNRRVLNQMAMSQAFREKWGALYSEKGVPKEETYPVRVQYLGYPSLPGYRILGNFDDFIEYRESPGTEVYDDKGKLVAVMPSIDQFGLNYHYNKDLRYQVQAISYKNNAHDINKASAATKSYITGFLGLRKETAAEKKRTDAAANMLGNAMKKHATADAKYGRNSKAARKAKNQAGAAAFLALLGSSNYDQAGSLWLEQVQKDWEDKAAGGSFSVNVIDNLTYSVDYYDKNNKPYLNVVYKYTQGKAPYTVNKTFTAKAI